MQREKALQLILDSNYSWRNKLRSLDEKQLLHLVEILENPEKAL